MAHNVDFIETNSVLCHRILDYGYFPIQLHKKTTLSTLVSSIGI